MRSPGRNISSTSATGAPLRRTPSTVTPNALARRATAVPIAPTPTTPIVEPAKVRPNAGAHCRSRWFASISSKRFQTASSRPITNSAIDVAAMPRTFVTVTPRPPRPAPARCSVPAAPTCTQRRFGASSTRPTGTSSATITSARANASRCSSVSGGALARRSSGGIDDRAIRRPRSSRYETERTSASGTTARIRSSASSGRNGNEK